MNTPIAEQKKEIVEAGGTKNENHNTIEERLGVYVGILGFGVAMLSLGIAWQSDKRADDRAREQDEKISLLQTQVLLAREDLRAIAPATTQLRSFTEPPKK